MHTRVVKLRDSQNYIDWIGKHNYSLYSSRHRGIYGKKIFLEYCKSQNIMAFQLHLLLPISDQIPVHFLKKIQQKELKNDLFPVDFFCIEKEKGYFVQLKMGTSPGKKVNVKRNKVFLVRVFEDAEMIIKEIKS